MAEYFAEGHLRFVNGEWRDDNGNAIEISRVRHGQWINPYINFYGHPCHCCSECGFKASYQDKNFCPNCGCKMSKKE